MCLRKPALAGVIAVALLAGCAGITAAIARFEERAGPAIARGCAEFHKAEANPLVQLALAAGTMAGNAATGGAAGLAVAAIRGFGERFCALGPPEGDSTSPEERAAWIAGIARQLIAEAAKVAGAVR